MLLYFTYWNSWVLLKYLKETGEFFVKLEVELSEANHCSCTCKDGWTRYARTLFTAILYSALSYVQHIKMKQNIVCCNITLWSHSLLIFASIHSLRGYPKEVGDPMTPLMTQVFSVFLPHHPWLVSFPWKFSWGHNMATRVPAIPSRLHLWRRK